MENSFGLTEFTLRSVSLSLRKPKGLSLHGLSCRKRYYVACPLARNYLICQR
jgi:hypothetical protein